MSPRPSRHVHQLPHHLIHRVGNPTNGMCHMSQYLKMKRTTARVYGISWTRRHNPKQNIPI